MAGKKIKPRKTSLQSDFANLKPSDVLCPICRTILIEPVTLSCSHAFCKLCFEGTMENANLVCPLCRVRVGSWFRKAKKDDKLVDKRLWEAIQNQYATEVQNKYQGIDNVIEEDVPVIVVAIPGEIRKEYELQRQKELEEQKKIREAEEKASAPLIQMLREEEEQRKREEDEKLRLDAALARKLAADLGRPSTSKITPKKVPENTKIDSGKKYGPMDKFIKTEETKLNRSLHRKEEQRKVPKTERKKISITPPMSDFATKEYTCHVLNAESHPTDTVNPYSIFNNRSSYNKASYNGGLPTVQKKIRQARKIIEMEERKSICRSGYKSSGSGSDDAIDQECKFYFKPIDTQKKYHLPGTIPLKIPSLRRKQVPNVSIEAPTGKIINLQLKTVISAFARFSIALQQKPQIQSSPAEELVKSKMSTYQVSSPKRLKRKIPDEDSPVRKKGRRQIYSKKNFQYINRGQTIDSPFYGFDNKPSRIVSSSPFYGFDTLHIKESNRERDIIKKLIAEQEHSLIDGKSAVSVDERSKIFKTYSRHQKRHSKVLQNTSSDIKLTNESLKLQISKTPKNGINMSEAIKDKLAELQSSMEVSSEVRNMTCQPKNNIDINRNISKTKLQSSTDGSHDVKIVKKSVNSNSTTSLSNTINGDSNLIFAHKNQNNFLINAKFQGKNSNCRADNMAEVTSGNIDKKEYENNFTSLQDFKMSKDLNLTNTSEKKGVVANSSDNRLSSMIRGKNSKTSSKTFLTSLKLVDYKNNSDISQKLNTNSSPVNTGFNGSWKTRQGKVQNMLHQNDTNSKTFPIAKMSKMSPISHSIPTSSISSDSDTTPKSTRLDDLSSYSVDKTYHTKTKNIVYMDTNSKITDTFSKTKSSPTKSKNTIKKLKLTPSKAKFNNNIELLNLESIQVNSDIDQIDFSQRQMQEQSDFELAKQLQAEFDAIQMPSRTRRGTKRQITLDEMLLI